MGEQMREALEGALTRRQVMEKAFDELSDDSAHGEAVQSGGGSGDGNASGDPGRAGSDTGGDEQVVKPSGNEQSIVDESKKPLKPLKQAPPQDPKSGKFAKQEAKGQQRPQQGQQQGEQQPQKTYEAPKSWKPALREKWNAIPPDAQEEIIRRENEINKALNDSAASRRFGSEFHKVVQPFEGMIRSSGVTPLQAVGHLMNTAAGLQLGTPQQKASIVSAMIKTYGIDLKILDSLLAGQQPPPESRVNDQLLSEIDRRLKPVQDFISNVQGSRQRSEQQLASESAQAAQEFAADPKNEFFEDVREDIADILEIAANRGRQITLQQAYDLACQQNPDIKKVLDDRAAAKKAQEDANRLQRSRRAASSQPSGSPGGVGAIQGKPEGRRAAISQAWDDLSGR